jgi:hypothetical protein
MGTRSGSWWAKAVRTRSLEVHCFFIVYNYKAKRRKGVNGMAKDILGGISRRGRQVLRLQKGGAALAAFLCACAALAGFLAYYASPYGPWAFSDSTEYLEAGRNFAAGRGFVLQRTENRYVPLSLRPPFYPFLLGAITWAGIDPVAGARGLNIALYPVLLLSVGACAYAFTRRAAIAGLLALYILTQPELADAFASLMSEPVFITLTLLQIGLLVLFVQSSDIKLLGAATVLTSALLLTRFAGAANLVILCAGTLLFYRRSLYRRIGTAALVGLAAALPFLVWSLSVRTSGYTPGVYDFRAASLWEELAPVRAAFTGHLWNWLPYRLLPFAPAYRAALGGIGIFFLGVAVWTGSVFYARLRSGGGSLLNRSAVQWSGLLILYAFAHLAVVAASYAWVQVPKPALYDRIVMHSQVTLVIGLAVLLYELGQLSIHRLGALLLPALILAPGLVSGPALVQQNLASLHAVGRGYTAKAWQGLQILEALQQRQPG